MIRIIHPDLKNQSTSLTLHLVRITALGEILNQSWSGYDLCLAVKYKIVG